MNGGLQPSCFILSPSLTDWHSHPRQYLEWLNQHLGSSSICFADCKRSCYELIVAGVAGVKM